MTASLTVSVSGETAAEVASGASTTTGPGSATAAPPTSLPAHPKPRSVAARAGELLSRHDQEGAAMKPLVRMPDAPQRPDWHGRLVQVSIAPTDSPTIPTNERQYQ